MKKLLLGIVATLLLAGCYSPTYISPAPTISPSPSPEPYRATVSIVKTYTASDYTYSFNYPGDWGDITSKIAPFLKGNMGAMDLKPDVGLGLYPDDYHGIVIVVCRFPAYYPSLSLKGNLNITDITGYICNWEYISSKESLVCLNDSPSAYSKYKQVYILNYNEILYFAIGAMGEKYYNSFDSIYSTFINSLDVYTRQVK